ncbi:hypothetical protein SBRCBS47491_006554 [Sporothrix bragantina]|uniref:Putative gamma-glutamylcyclotransferase n=1 Tax=Sporothrix bragantina TaxID=671064 RepID=A0ABP0C5W1_9PEZI
MADNSADTATAPSDGTSHGFFYGTLMAPEVFFTVCYRDGRPPAAIANGHVFRSAVLPGFTRHRVQNQEYPGIIEDDTPGACVRGMLVSGVTDGNQHHLDFFEGSEYERRTVEVVLDAAGDEPKKTETETETEKDKDAAETKKETAMAQVYVFKYPDLLERREWDFEEFRREKMHKWSRAEYTFAGPFA